MDDGLTTIQRLLREVAEHLKAATKADRRAAVAKLQRIASISQTLAFTIDAKR